MIVRIVFLGAVLRSVCRCVRAAILYYDYGRRAMIIDITESWTPTSENINALPEPVRRYIHDIESSMDFAGIADLMRESFRLRQENTALHRECERLATLSRRV